MIQYILDTNILVHYVRGDDTWAKIRDEYSLLAIDPCPFISEVTIGEMRSLSLQYSWGESKRDLMLFVLGYFIPVSISRESIYESYSTIDATCQARGIALGKNDLWIAATASATGSTLLTTDHDFDHIPEALSTRIWIDPATR